MPIRYNSKSIFDEMGSPILPPGKANLGQYDAIMNKKKLLVAHGDNQDLDKDELNQAEKEI